MLKWLKLCGVTGGGQTIVQVIGFLSGIIVIRFITVEDYAFYTLANTMLGMMTIFANSGVTAGAMVEGGKVCENKQLLGSIINCGMRVRRTLAMYSVSVCIPLLLYLLLRNGASLAVAFAIVAALIPAFLSALSTPLLDIPLRLHQRIWTLQHIQIGSALWRLAFTFPVLWIFPSAFAALLTAGCAQMYTNVRLRVASRDYVDRTQPIEPEVHGRIVAMVRKVLPSTLYLTFTSQIAIWLVSIFGSPIAVAQVGALSRFGVIFFVVKAMVVTLFVPRFTRLPNRSGLLFRRFVQVQILLGIIAAVALSAVALAGTSILSLIGPQYKGLERELFLMATASLATLATFTAARLNESRSWIIRPELLIAISVCVQVGLAIVLKPATAHNAFLYMAVFQMVLYIVLCIYFLLRLQGVKTAKEKYCGSVH